MKFITRDPLLIFLIIFQTSFSLLSADPLLHIDFTKDSTYWQSKLPKVTWNAVSTDYQASLNNLKSDNYVFQGSWGKFYAGHGTMAQPFCLDNISTNRRWAFRIDNNGSSYLEMPEIANAGRLTIFCKNGNAGAEGSFTVQQKVGENWETLRTVYLPPHYNQNYEMQVEELLNINSAVKLRIYGATKKIHVYEIQIDAYSADVPKEKPLRLVLIPDGQTYVKQDYLNEVYWSQFRWINQHADSIAFVLQQGDITGGNFDAQWEVAGGAFSLIEGRKVPFTFCAGNHDMGKMSSSRDTKFMNEYLPYSRYSRQPTFGGTFEANTVDNTWHTFSKGKYHFLILSLEYTPRDKVLDWANEIIKQHPKHNVIINTHAYLKADNKPFEGQIKQQGISNESGAEFANNGKNMWDKMVSLHPNCLFTFNGHVTGKGIGHLVSEGKKGNKVYQFLANYQAGVDGPQEERNGMLRIIDLDPEHKSFTIKTYSPYTGKFNTAEGQQFDYKNVEFIKGE